MKKNPRLGICMAPIFLFISIAWPNVGATEATNVSISISRLLRSSTFPDIDDAATTLGVTVDKKLAPPAFAGSRVYYPVLRNRWGITSIEASRTKITILFDGSYCVEPRDIAKAARIDFVPDEVPGMDGGPPERTLLARLGGGRFVRLPFIEPTGCAGYVSLHGA